MADEEENSNAKRSTKAVEHYQSKDAQTSTCRNRWANAARHVK